MKKGYEGFRIADEKESAKRLRARRERAEKNAAGRQTNEAFAANDTQFRSDCAAVGVNPTRRQASKFRNGKGAVHGHLNGRAGTIRDTLRNPNGTRMVMT